MAPLLPLGPVNVNNFVFFAGGHRGDVLAIEKRTAKRQVPHEMTIVQKGRICIFRDFAANDLHIV